MHLEAPNYVVQYADLFEVERESLMVDAVDMCLADSQNLKIRTTTKTRYGTKRVVQTVQSGTPELYIWGLTLQQIALGLSVLAEGGRLVYRSGWRDCDEDDYKRAASLAVLSIIEYLFRDVAYMKSEVAHQADPTYYVVADGLRKTEVGELPQLLLGFVPKIIEEDVKENLVEILRPLTDAYVTAGRKERVLARLDRVNRLRLIAEQGRMRLRDGTRTITISPAPSSLTIGKLRRMLSPFGRIESIRRHEHMVGVGADIVITFAQRDHAEASLEALDAMFAELRVPLRNCRLIEQAEARQLREDAFKRVEDKQNVVTLEDEVRISKGLPTVAEERARAEEDQRMRTTAQQHIASTRAAEEEREVESAVAMAMADLWSVPLPSIELGDDG